MSILTALAEIGAIYAAKAAAKSQEVRAPSEIAGAFSVGSPMQNGATYFIDISIDKETSPVAGAYEWGSGLHATRGKKEKYKIEPKNKMALAFFWDKVDSSTKTAAKFMGISSTTGKAIFNFVEHPGVEKRPYLVPTINETKAEFKKILGKGFKAEVLQGVNKIEVIEVK